MKKCLSLLLALALLLVSAAAFAEAAPVSGEFATPFTYPALPEEIYTQWQLFVTETAPEWRMTSLSDPETNCFVITLFNPVEWGVSEEYCGSWKYDLENTKWMPMEAAAPDIAPDAVVLYMDAEEYYMNGFPGWQAYSADERFYYMLEDYSGDPNNSDYYLTFVSDDASIQYSLAGNGFSVSSFTEEIMSYGVYSAEGVLEIGSYIKTTDDTYATYSVTTPDDPEAEEDYILSYINVQTADGGNYLWTEDVWQDIHGEEVAAPEGFSAEELPFELIRP